MSIEQEALLTAYALGELEGTEKETIEAALATSPEKRAWVEEVQALAGLLSTELTSEIESALNMADDVALTPQQRAAIDEQIDVVSTGIDATEVVALDEQTNASPRIDEPDPVESDALEVQASLTSGWARWLGGATVATVALLLLVTGNSYFMLHEKSPPTIQAPLARRMLPLSKRQHRPAPAMVDPKSSQVPRFAQETAVGKARQLRQRLKTSSNAPVDKDGLDKQNKNKTALNGYFHFSKHKRDEVSKGSGNAGTSTLVKETKRGGSEGKDGDRSQSGKTEKNGKKAQVWQRSRRNTILSKVSVGGKNYLVLKKMRVTVQVEGLRARTVIDHIYYNPHGRTLQGTFKYTLPPRSTVSYYAMFVGQQRRTPRFFTNKVPARQLLRMAPQKMARRVKQRSWGRLREARLVAAVKGRQVYEEITRRRIDPALLEQDAPNTFTGRVFPIPAKGYNRVIIAYEQTLPQLRGDQVYRFRFPTQVAESIDFSIEYDQSKAALHRSNLRKIRCRAPQGKPFMRCYWEKNKPKRDAVFYFTPKDKKLQWVAGSDPVDSRKYLMGRLRVKLPAAKARFGASHALFALDTSLSGNPDLFAAQVRLLRAILQRNQAHITHFNVLLFDVNTRWVNAKKWIANTKATRRALWGTLQEIVLEGATNIEAAMQALAAPPWQVKRGTPVDIFMLSDGQANWGQTQLHASIGRFRKARPYGQVRFFTYQMGIGAENTAFAMRLAREGGASFSCLGKAEIPRCAVAHTRPSMLLEKLEIKGVGATEVLVEGRQVSLYPDGLLAFAARIRRAGPATLILTGQYRGKPLTLRHNFRVTSTGELAPRAWAELAVAQLTELNDDKLTPLIVAYAQHFRIPNQHCSFLVLETDKEYKQYGLDKLRKKERVVDVAQWLASRHKQFGIVSSPRAAWHALFRRAVKKAGVLRQSTGRAIFSLLQRTPASHFVFTTPAPKREWQRRNVSKAYLQTRLRDRNQFDPFVKEAKRRLQEDVAGAIRALSCIVELHPSNPQAMRLVGYYLMGWKRPAAAAQLFFRVLQRRPFEPHAYRDLARALAKLDRYPLAAALYEIILARKWHNRFGLIHTIAREEYALLLQQAANSDAIRPSVRSMFRRRKAMLGLKVKRSLLRVTVTWNTDSTDIDLWVTEPNGDKCSYRKRQTTHGGKLLQDITRGYGPERYENVGGKPGKYKIQLNFYGHTTNTLGNETHASILIVTDAGTKGQRIIERNVVLKRRKQIVTISELKL